VGLLVWNTRSKGDSLIAGRPPITTQTGSPPKPFYTHKTLRVFNRLLPFSNWKEIDKKPVV